MDVRLLCMLCVVCSAGSGICDELTTRSHRFYRERERERETDRVCVCVIGRVLDTRKIRWSMSNLGCCATEEIKYYAELVSAITAD